MVERFRNVAVVGGGFSGAMLAARLAQRGIASALINRTADFGLGVAYATSFDGHLLNVRSGRMSALADTPDDFVRWLATQAPAFADPDGFAPRRVFGRYVQARLTQVEAAHPRCIDRVVGEVRAVATDGVTLSDGRHIAAGAVVLATGNPAPRTASGDTTAGVIPDPWAPGALDRIAPEDDIVIIGTGLTMVDMVLVLEARGWRGRATALSRRGLLPRAHADQPETPTPPGPALVTGPVSTRLAEARRSSDRQGWREMMEGLRPLTTELWCASDTPTRARIVRHLRPWWDVHRHRIAPDVASVIYRLYTDARLVIVAGRVRNIAASGEKVALAWRPRRGPAMSPLIARWVIDCTGPGHAAETDPITGPLLASGRARLDPLRLGLDLDRMGRVLNAEGEADPTLYVLGPPARAAFWETIAVPDIRNRIEDVTQALAARAG